MEGIMKKPVNVTLDAELWKRFRIRAIEDGTSGSAVLDSLIRAYLGESSYAPRSRRDVKGKRTHAKAAKTAAS
jgi:hypothetical protein